MHNPSKRLLTQADKAASTTAGEGGSAWREAAPRFEQAHLRDAELLSKLIHKIGHEVGNPLTSIISLASIIERFSAVPGNRAADGEDKTSQYAGSIIKEAWRISGLAERLVLLLSTRAGSPVVHPALDAVNRTLSRLERREKMDCDLIRIRVHGSQPPNILIDPDQFMVAMGELLQNAFRAAVETARDELVTDVPILIDLAADGAWTTVQVTSFSSQSCPYDLHAVFEPFVTQFVEQKCLGLGLPMVASVVERVGGKVTVSERPHEGSFAFTTSLQIPAEDSVLRSSDDGAGAKPRPAAGREDAAAAETSAASAATRPPEEGALPAEVRICIIEDEPLVASAIKKILEISLAQHTRLTCRCLSGAQAVDAISAGEHFDCFLCDLTLEGMSGRYVLETLAEKQPEAVSRFAFVTGDQSRRETQTYLESSQRPFLHKPFAPEDLLALVLNLVTGSDAQKELA